MFACQLNSFAVIDDELRMNRSKVAQRALRSNPNEAIPGAMHHSVAAVSRDAADEFSVVVARLAQPIGIPERATVESRGRGVLDTPHSPGMTAQADR